MGVNTNLAAGARAVHANRGAGSKYDVGAAFGKSLGKAMESISTRAEAHERDRRAIGAKVEKWGSKLDDSISTKHVPEAYQQDVAKFAARSRDEYWQFAQMASKSDAGSSAYIEAVTGMNQINSSMKNLKNELVKFAEGGTTFAADNKSKHLSAGNNNVDLNQLSDVYSQSMPLTIGADGSLAFDQEDGSSISLDQLPEYHKKDFAGAQDFLKKVNTIHKAGRPLDVTLTGMYESELTNMLEAGGRARMLDFAVGNTVTVGGLGIQNPHDMPDEELLAAVRSGMMNVLVESANNGAKERTGRSNKGSDSSDDFGFGPSNYKPIIDKATETVNKMRDSGDWSALGQGFYKWKGQEISAVRIFENDHLVITTKDGGRHKLALSDPDTYKLVRGVVVGATSNHYAAKEAFGMDWTGGVLVEQKSNPDQQTGGKQEIVVTSKGARVHTASGDGNMATLVDFNWSGKTQ